MDYNTIEINLEQSGSQVPSRTSASYEEAFLGGGSEEMSNLRGRGRARRKKRKLERIANKREVRTERRKLKSDRQEERIARRKKRKQSRQEMRDEQQEARMERRNKRREDRENRRGREPEVDEEEDTQTTQGYATEDQDEDDGSTGYYSDDEDEDDGSTGYASDDEDEDDGSTGYYSDDEDEDDGSEDYGSEDEDEASFDGNSYDFDGESSEFISEATGSTTKVSPLIQEICMKIEWNNEMLMRLANKKKQMLSQGQDVSAVNSAIDQKFDRVQTLENKLENFAGADGKRDRKKSKEVQLARKMARRKRLAMASNVIPPVLIAKLLKKGLSKEQIQKWWQEKGSTRFGKKSKFDGNESVSDRVMIVDEPVDVENFGMPSYEYDVDLGSGAGHDPMSFANGETSGSGNFWKSVLIGVAVGGVLIYVIRKYKLLKD